MSVRVFPVLLHGYTLDGAPDFLTLGQTLDALLIHTFPNRTLAVRGISAVDHPGKSATDLIGIVQQLGTDRYDPMRKGILETFYAPYNLDLHALPCAVTADGQLVSSHDDGGGVMSGMLADFFHGPPLDRGSPPMRLDLLTVYDRAQLEAVAVDYGEGLNQDPCEFRFKNADRKLEALLGIVHLL
jgi:hypothetical protein